MKKIVTCYVCIKCGKNEPCYMQEVTEGKTSNFPDRCPFKRRLEANWQIDEEAEDDDEA